MTIPLSIIGQTNQLACPTDEALFATRVGAIITYQEPGPAAFASMVLRLKTLAFHSPRAIPGDVKFNAAGLPWASVEFGCGDYNKPVNGSPDTRAIRDFWEAIENINGDGILLVGPVGLLTPDDTWT